MNQESFEAIGGDRRTFAFVSSPRKWRTALLVGLLLVAPAFGNVTLVAAPAEGGERAISHRLGLGTSLLYAQRFDEAAIEFERILEIDPLHRDARMGLARAHFWSGRPRRATDALTPLMADTPDAEVVALYNEVAAATGDSLLALEAIRESVAARPDVPELQESKADLLVATGCFIPAIEILKDLYDTHPDSAKHGLALAHAYFTADRYPEAIDLYGRFLDVPGPYGVRAHLGLARTQLKERRVDESVEVLEALRTRAPDEPRVAIGLLQCWLADPEESETDPETLLADLASPEARRRIATDDEVREWLYVLVGQLVNLPLDDERSEAAEKLAEVVTFEEMTPAFTIARDALSDYAEEGPTLIQPDVEELTERIRAGDVERADVYEAANLLLLLYADESLVDVCDAALELQPNDIPIMLFRAEGLAIRPDYDKAADNYQAILDKLPECSKAHRGLARTYSWQRRFDKATDTYDELIELDATDMVMQREHARSLGWDKQLRDSLDAYDEAVEDLGETPPEEDWRHRLETERDAKRAYWWRRDQRALETYTELIEAEPTNLEARFDLAQIYANHRHWEEAAEQYHDILSIDARHRRARDALYKNALYHRPEVRFGFDWSRQRGRGGLLDIETARLTETFKQEIARRTDLSFTAVQMWHRFQHARRWQGVQRMGRYRFNEFQYMLRLDHTFDMKTHGHVAGGLAVLPGTKQEHRLIWDAALTHELTDWLNLTVGTQRQPWRKNVITVEQALNEEKVFLELFGEVDPWLDLWGRYSHSCISSGGAWLDSENYLRTPSNRLDELAWGANYRFSLFPRILQFEYSGFAWWFDREVPTYFSPSSFMTHLFRLGWRHYLNTDQYFEQKQLYYELGVTGSVDSQGVWGWGYDAALGWDICHHFGLEAKWSQARSTTYDAELLTFQLVSRF